MFKFSSTSRSHAKIVSDANQSSLMVERKRFFIMRSLLRHRSAEQLVAASEANIVYTVVKLG